MACHCIPIPSMKTMKTNDENTYLSLSSNTKKKKNKPQELKYNNTKFTNKSAKNFLL